MNIERRYSTRRVNIEKRADGKEVIVGYAAVFYRSDDPGTQFQLYTDIVERIMPTAFDAALRENDDVRGLFNHDVSLVLGRRPAETLRLSVDTVGLRYEIDPPDAPNGQNVKEALKRGDVNGSSFAFLIYSGKRGKVVWVEEKLPDGRMISVREIHDCELIDVGPVTYPAYGSTSAGVRSSGVEEKSILEERDNWRAMQRTPADIDMEMLQRNLQLLGTD